MGDVVRHKASGRAMRVGGHAEPVPTPGDPFDKREPEVPMVLCKWSGDEAWLREDELEPWVGAIPPGV